MIKKISKFLAEISKLSAKEQELLSKLNNFQIEVLKQLNFEKSKKVSKLISLDNSISKAQKYRYINELVRLKICKISNKNLELKKN